MPVAGKDMRPGFPAEPLSDATELIDVLMTEIGPSGPIRATCIKIRKITPLKDRSDTK